MTTDMVCLIIGIATQPAPDTVPSIEVITGSDEAALTTASFYASLNPSARYFLVRATEVRTS